MLADPMSPMGEVTAAEFYRALDELRENLRRHIDLKFAEVRHALEEHEAEDRRVADDVLKIKTERTTEAAQAAKNAAWVALVVSGGIGALFKWILK